MTEQVILTLVVLIGALGIIFLFKGNKRNFIKNGLLTFLYHVFYVILLFLPIAYSFLSISDTLMNWTGKILTILFSIIFYIIARRHFEEHDYVFSIAAKRSYKKIAAVGLITASVMVGLTLVFSQSKELNLEILFYQITMPGLDEELWRGIVIGLLVPVVNKGKFRFGHPTIWATTLIFALGHSVFLQNWVFEFAFDAFVITGILGYILGWMTYASKSILPAIIFHNLINFSTNFIEMIIL
ncbi:MAG: CPBP family intramembrane glutamic endopeptidase [Bacteroidota bacterium]